MRWRRDRTLLAVATVVAAAVLVRIVGLGTRPFHWDEARIGYWSLRTLESGTFEVRPVAGGPLVSHLSRHAIAVGGASDAVARVPVAVLTGLLPAVALLFRDRLRDDETVALAVVLGFTPLVAYYGRFLRGDVLAAGAALAVVGCCLRWVDTDRDRFLYAAAALAAVALAASGFAVATAVLLLASGLLVLDEPRVAGRGRSVPETVASGGAWTAARATPLARALFAFLGAWGVLFAPRGYGVLADPIGFLLATYRDPVTSFLAVRVAGREGTEFLPFLTSAVGTLVATSAVVAALALGGFLADRYRALPAVETERSVVALAAFWAGLGLLGYPIVAAVVAPWTLVHVLVPASVPAAVGVAATYRYGRRALDREDAARAAAALLLLAAVGAGVGVAAVDGVYGPNAPENSFASYGQPASDLEPLVGTIDAATAGDGTVVYVGERYHASDEAALDAPPIDAAADRSAFGERLPLAWYVARTDAAVASVASPEDIGAVAGDRESTVLVADPAHEGAVAERFPDHEAETVELALWNREVVVFVKGSSAEP
ncbi:flippase activity-associated protein Agl23 [Halorubrum sp. DTA98]|uniref:flippase activity-associated protein Agl23 n=1 Tax=Halorubrum sp. DTA98 TaxID=3402163 RepID=UPI003AAD1A9B